MKPEDRKKIIHVVSSLNVGGAERFVIDLGERQLLQGHKVAILSFGDAKEQLFEIAKENGINVYSTTNASNPLGQLYILSVLMRFDIIHIHTSYALKTLSIAIKCLSNKKCIYTRHGAAPVNSNDWVKIHNNFRKYISAMSFVSSEAMSIFTSNYNWPEIPKEVIDNGVVLPELVEQDKKIVAPVNIGSVGRFVPLKHQICLLKAINLLDEEYLQKVCVHFFGDGECGESLREYAASHLHEHNVEFHGMISDREKIYSAFDFLVVTSETEGLSLAIMESLAFGKPVIATDVGGNGYLLNNQANGWLVEYDKEQELADTLKLVIGNPESVREKGEQGHDFIKNNYSINAAASKYEQLYTL